MSLQSIPTVCTVTDVKMGMCRLVRNNDQQISDYVATLQLSVARQRYDSGEETMRRDESPMCSLHTSKYKLCLILSFSVNVRETHAPLGLWGAPPAFPRFRRLSSGFGWCHRSLIFAMFSLPSPFPRRLYFMCFLQGHLSLDLGFTQQFKIISFQDH